MLCVADRASRRASNVRRWVGRFLADAAKALDRHRLDRRQRVLHPMVELVDEEALRRVPPTDAVRGARKGVRDAAPLPHDGVGDGRHRLAASQGLGGRGEVAHGPRECGRQGARPRKAGDERDEPARRQDAPPELVDGGQRPGCVLADDHPPAQPRVVAIASRRSGGAEVDLAVVGPRADAAFAGFRRVGSGRKRLAPERLRTEEHCPVLAQDDDLGTGTVAPEGARQAAREFARPGPVEMGDDHAREVARAVSDGGGHVEEPERFARLAGEAAWRGAPRRAGRRRRGRSGCR